MFIALLSCNDTDQKTTLVSSSTLKINYYNDDELTELGFKIIKLNDRQKLLCSKGNDKDCVCIEDLKCNEPNSNCIKFKNNIDIFRSAVADGQDGRTVSCERAEIGVCGNLQYFRFDGDNYLRELRWFDMKDNLVAQRNSTDYFAYCNGKARTRFMGKIPKCSGVMRQELICGKASKKQSNTIEDLRRIDMSLYQ